MFARRDCRQLGSEPRPHLRNWARGVDGKGQPIPDPKKEPQFDGSLVSPNQGGAANWPPPTFDPDTGLFYVNAARAYSVWYLYDVDPKPEGWEERIVAGGRNRCCRQLTIRPAEIHGAISGMAMADVQAC